MLRHSPEKSRNINKTRNLAGFFVPVALGWSGVIRLRLKILAVALAVCERVWFVPSQKYRHSALWSRDRAGRSGYLVLRAKGSGPAGPSPPQQVAELEQLGAYPEQFRAYPE